MHMKTRLGYLGFLVLVTALHAVEPAAPPAASVIAIEGTDYPVFKIEAVEPIKQVAPRYPVWEGEAGVSANVVVLVLVDRQGKPAEVSVKSSESSPKFGEAAVRAVKQWQFQPAVWKGEPTEYIVQVPLAFRASRREAEGNW